MSATHPPAPPGPLDRARGTGPLLLAVAVFVMALWAQTGAMVGAFYDDGIYVTLAKALAEGEGYRNIHLVGAPPAVHYPPLYAFLLSLLWRIWPTFPDNVVLFKLFDAGALAAAAWLLARYAGRWPLSVAGRYLALALGFAAFPLLTIVGVRFSEPLFLALFVAAVTAADQERVTVGWGVASGALAGLSALTRGVGIAVVAGVAIALWLRGARRSAVAAAGVAFLVIAPWVAWTALHAGDLDPRIASNYGTYFGEARVSGVHFGAWSPVLRLAIPTVPAAMWYPLAALLTGMVLWGAGRVWRGAPALVASLALYLAIVSLWHYVPDRFLWIICPFVALLAAAGTQAAWAQGAGGRTAAVVLGMTLLAGYGRREFASLGGRGFARAAEQASTPLRWLAPAIEQGTPRGAVIASEAEAGIFLYTGRRVVPSALFRWVRGGTADLEPDTVVRFFCGAGVTHLAQFAPDGSAAPVVARLRQLGDSNVVALFTLASGPALYRFRCPS